MIGQQPTRLPKRLGLKRRRKTMRKAAVSLPFIAEFPPAVQVNGWMKKESGIRMPRRRHPCRSRRMLCRRTPKLIGFRKKLL